MGKLIYLFNYVKGRWSEPSTHAAICSVLVMAGMKVPEGIISDLLTALSVVFGMLGVFVKESQPETKAG